MKGQDNSCRRRLAALGTAVLLGLGFSACESPPPPETGAETEGSLTPGPEARETETKTESQEEAVFPPPDPEGKFPVSTFGEIWGYLVRDREWALVKGLPLSDVGYFDVAVDSYGKLGSVPDPRKVPPFQGRLHLVATCGGRALTHFVLAEGSRERKELIQDLIAAARNFQGLQIDFENVPPRDAGPFHSFLRELRAGLGNKTLTAAIPARTKPAASDVYDYEKIKPLVDRVLVMAYDEHWSGSKPGPIASMEWCRRVAAHALKTIGPEKLIMGIPFYGRAWGHINPSGAYIHSGIKTLVKENNSEISRENGIPTFEYVTPVSVKVYYEDDHSLAARMSLYRHMGVNAVGFWRLGQETPAVWNFLRLGD
jgi:hypothetical protein